MTLPKAVERYLRAAFPNHKRLVNEDDLGSFARDVQRRAFPDLHGPLEFAFLRSRRRHCEQFLHGELGVIVIDQGLTTLLAAQDAILRARSYDPEQGLVLMYVPFAEAFRYHNDVERSLYCVMRSLEKRQTLAGLVKAAFEQSGHSSLGVFVLLHELAHFGVDTGQPFTASIVGRVKKGLDDHCNVNVRASERLRRGESLGDIEASVADQSPEQRATMARQMEEHVAHLRSNTEIVRETSCDVLAGIGFLAFLLGHDVLEKDHPAVGVSAMQVGDILLQGLKASRLLMAMQFLDQTAKSAAEQSDPSVLAPAFSQMTGRHNIATNIILGLFQGIAEGWQFAPARDASPLDAMDPVELFSRGITVASRQSTERLLQPIEDIGLFHRDTEAYTAEFDLMKRRLFPGQEPTHADLAARRDQYLDLLPL